MTKKFCLTLAVISTAFIPMVSAQQTAKVTSSGIGYLEYLPQGYHSNANKYPVVISLHGIREKGTSSTDRNKVLADLPKVDNVGLPKYVKYGAKYPFILISPQLKSNYGSWPASYVIQVLNYVKKHLRIDERRVYLTGLSLGGLGVWKTAGEYPEVFAAIAPICPGGNSLSQADDIAAKNVAAWGFHGNQDRIVSYTVTTKMISAINSAPKRPNPLAKATIFPGMGHIIWDKAYQHTNLLDWMLSHRRGSTPPDSNHDNDDDGNENEDEDDEEANKTPVVKAGGDRTLVLPANSLYVDGKADDPDGKITSYKWAKVSGGSASLSGTTSPRLRAYNLKEGTYVFRLTAKDNDGATRSDEVRVVVRKKNDDGSDTDDDDDDKPSSRNKTPRVYTGPDRVLTLPTDAITIRGQATDSDGKIVAYEWAQTYGKHASMSGVNTTRVRIYNLKRGVYIFRLRARDNDGGIKDDYFKITVRESDGNDDKTRPDDNDDSSNNKANSRPYAYAGPDRVLRLPSNAVTVRSETSDKDGRVVSYQWTKTYGRRASISGARSPNAHIHNLQEGVYIFRLTVKDNDGAVRDDYFKITVED